MKEVSVDDVYKDLPAGILGGAVPSTVEDMVEYMRPTDVKDIGINISGGQFDPTIKDYYIIPGGGSGPIYESTKDYPSKYVGKAVIDPDPDPFADSDYIENDKIVRKPVVAVRSQIGKSYVRDGGEGISYPSAVYASNISDAKLQDLDLTSVAEQNSKNLEYLKAAGFPGKSIYTQGKVLSDDELRTICNIKRDGFAEFENKAMNRRYLVS